MTPTQKVAAALLLLTTLASPGMPSDRHVAPRSGDGGTPLRVHVFPRFARAPALVRIDVFVEPGAADRMLEVALDSGSYYRSSAIELNGADAPRVHYVEFRAVPIGTHDVSVTLTTTVGLVRATVRDRVAISE